MPKSSLKYKGDLSTIKSSFSWSSSNIFISDGLKSLSAFIQLSFDTICGMEFKLISTQDISSTALVQATYSSLLDSENSFALLISSSLNAKASN